MRRSVHSETEIGNSRQKEYISDMLHGIFCNSSALRIYIRRAKRYRRFKNRDTETVCAAVIFMFFISVYKGRKVFVLKNSRCAYGFLRYYCHKYGFRRVQFKTGRHVNTCGVRLHSHFNDNKRKDFKEQFAFMDNRHFTAFGRYYSVNCRCGDRCKNPVLQS